MKVLIDDMREMKVDVIARTAKEGKEVLMKNKGKVTALYIDHDLGEDESGYDVIVWALRHKVLPPFVRIVFQLFQ